MQIAVLDKTGTITSGEPAVTDILPFGADEQELLTAAVSLEKRSEHPLAKAVLRYADERGIIAREVTDFAALSGSGLTAKLDGAEVSGGNLRFIESKTTLSAAVRAKADELANEGKTPLFFARAGSLLGIIAVADTIRADSREAVKQLKNMGLHVVMLTGDNKRTAAAIGSQAGVDEVIAGVLPDGKDAVIRELQKHGKVTMVGDGINDAPALTRADIGIAIGAGTDIAIDAADVVLMKSTLSDAAAAIRLSRAVLRNIKQNLFWAFIYNVIGIPLAAGAYIAAFGWELDPMFGAAAMSLSSFCVVMNALRLNLFCLHDTAHDKPRKSSLAADVKLNITIHSERTVILRIEGMMCPHCEATVKKTLEQFPEVTSAEPSHEKGTAVLHLNGELLHLEEIKTAIADKGYTVIDMEIAQ